MNYNNEVMYMENIDLANLIRNRETITSYLQKLIDTFNSFDGIVGDVPVSEQLAAAISRMATKEHTHDDYVTRKEYESLKSDVNKLLDLVGDVSVSEQIGAALRNK